MVDPSTLEEYYSDMSKKVGDRVAIEQISRISVCRFIYLRADTVDET